MFKELILQLKALKKVGTSAAVQQINQALAIFLVLNETKEPKISVFKFLKFESRFNFITFFEKLVSSQTEHDTFWDGVNTREIGEKNPKPNIQAHIWKSEKRLSYSNQVVVTPTLVYRVKKNTSQKDIIKEIATKKRYFCDSYVIARSVIKGLILAGKADLINRQVFVYFIDNHGKMNAFRAIRHNDERLYVNLLNADILPAVELFHNDFVGIPV